MQYNLNNDNKLPSEKGLQPINVIFLGRLWDKKRYNYQQMSQK